VLDLVTGEQVPLSIAVTDENGDVIASPELLFRSADPEVAQVSPDGYVTAGEQGLTNVFVTSGGLRDQVEVRVHTP
jgi:hypothetical protein